MVGNPDDLPLASLLQLARHTFLLTGGHISGSSLCTEPGFTNSALTLKLAGGPDYIAMALGVLRIWLMPCKGQGSTVTQACFLLPAVHLLLEDCGHEATDERTFIMVAP